MSGSALVSALIVGVAVGVAGRLVVPGRTAAPVWLTLALGVAAALLGSIVVRLVGADVVEPTLPRLLVQSGSAGVVVVLAVVTAGRQRPAARPEPDPCLHRGGRRPAPPPGSGVERKERS